MSQEVIWRNEQTSVEKRFFYGYATRKKCTLRFCAALPCTQTKTAGTLRCPCRPKYLPTE
ncbi:hypothetical protein TH25_21615 [Thalassospira profundimaris]|uniref:Uncharacterized protein n=1 Tax=Thalassospira profundimaris TaxID=502049 RepID=A0A367WPV8_9PROT|nr:hypothetical protein TH25_21615 [Thalassospira profundimaris]